MQIKATVKSLLLPSTAKMAEYLGGADGNSHTPFRNVTLWQHLLDRKTSNHMCRYIYIPYMGTPKGVYVNVNGQEGLVCWRIHGVTLDESE